MTVKEFLENKYRERMKDIRPRDWEIIKENAKYKKLTIPQYMMMCFEIKEYDIKNNGGYNGEFYAEISDLHSNKLLASNKHRQAHRHVTAYWLTIKGVKKLGF